MAAIEGVWVFTQDGIPMVDFYTENSGDTALFSSFMSAVQSFTKQASGKDLNSFQIGDSKYNCVKCLKDSIYLIIKAHKNIKENKIYQICEIITDIFEQMFSEEQLSCWDGDLSLFDEFKKKIDLYFKLRNL